MKPSDPRALQLAHRVESTYAALDRYSDQGVMNLVGDHRLASFRFETRFRSPDQFSFQTSKPKAPATRVWVEGGQAMLRKGNQDKRVASITEAFVEMSGGSDSPGEVGLIAASLLMPRLLESNLLSSMWQILWTGERTWEGRKYSVIQGTILPGEEIEFWINPTTFLIERTRHPGATEGSSVDIIIHPHRD